MKWLGNVGWTGKNKTKKNSLELEIGRNSHAEIFCENTAPVFENNSLLLRKLLKTFRAVILLVTVKNAVSPKTFSFSQNILQNFLQKGNKQWLQPTHRHKFKVAPFFFFLMEKDEDIPPYADDGETGRSANGRHQKRQLHNIGRAESKRGNSTVFVISIETACKLCLFLASNFPDRENKPLVPTYRPKWSAHPCLSAPNWHRTKVDQSFGDRLFREICARKSPAISVELM